MSHGHSPEPGQDHSREPWTLPPNHILEELVGGGLGAVLGGEPSTPNTLLLFKRTLLLFLGNNY